MEETKRIYLREPEWGQMQFIACSPISPSVSFNLRLLSGKVWL
jgi:hypothetical protein